MERIDFENARAAMVADQIVARGVENEAVIRAMRTVPREAFVPPQFAREAYSDCPLPIPAGQTISQPYVVAVMLAALELGPDDVVLEIGAGSGYAAALISRIVNHVHTVERHAELAEYARSHISALGYENVTVHHRDGSSGLPEYAPFDAIVVAAGGPHVPPSLRKQLADGGRLVMPVGRWRRHQTLIRIRRKGSSFRQEELGAVAFVPLIGSEGWENGEDA